MWRFTAWAERYFLTEVTTGERSRKEQARDFRLFIAFLRHEIGSEECAGWTPRVSREFVDYLRSQLHEDGQHPSPTARSIGYSRT
jgi:hypothetical protein